MKKKPFVYTGDEIRAGKTRYGTPVYDGVFCCVEKNKYIRVRARGEGTNLIRRNGQTFKAKGRGGLFDGDCL